MSFHEEKSSKKKQRPFVFNNEGYAESYESMAVEDFEGFIGDAVREFESQLIGYARSFLGDTERSRDVVQDTFIRLCKQNPEDVRSKLKSWLFTVCRNRCLDILRKDKRLQPLEDKDLETKYASQAASGGMEAKEDFERVLQLLEQLPSNQKKVILLKFHQGMSYREIHKKTGLKEGNIGFMIHSGLKRLREWVTNKEEADR